jgi:hypothetical protein
MTQPKVSQSGLASALPAHRETSIGALARRLALAGLLLAALTALASFALAA